MVVPPDSRKKICDLLNENNVAKIWSLGDTNTEIIKICRKAIALDDVMRKNLFQSYFVQAKCSNSIMTEPETLLLRHIVFNGGVMTLNNFKFVTQIESKKVREAMRGLEEEEKIIMTVVLHRNVKVLMLYLKGVKEYIRRNKF